MNSLNNNISLLNSVASQNTEPVSNETHNQITGGLYPSNGTSGVLSGVNNSLMTQINTGSCTGTLGQNSLAVTTCPQWYYSYPYNYYGSPQIVTSDTYMTLRKVENGWVLLKNGKEYILKSPDEISKYLKDSNEIDKKSKK